MQNMKSLSGAVLLALILLSGCNQGGKQIPVSVPPEVGPKSEPSGPSEDWTHFLDAHKDVVNAPTAMQLAANAVVKIEYPDFLSMGTGFFVGPSLLATNLHVVPTTVCARSGCAMNLYLNYQVGSKPELLKVRAVPFNRSLDADVVLLSIRREDGSEYTHANFLEVQDPGIQTLIGQNLNVVGHPSGAPKKWSSGIAFDASELAGSGLDWLSGRLTISALALPGNSGSPILTDDGKVVGIVKSIYLPGGVSAVMQVNRVGTYTLTAGEPSKKILQVMHEGNRPERFTELSTAFADISEQGNLLYYAGVKEVESSFFGFFAQKKKIDELLARQCRLHLKLSWSLAKPLCLSYVSWLNCADSRVGSCPSSDKAKASSLELLGQIAEAIAGENEVPWYIYSKKASVGNVVTADQTIHQKIEKFAEGRAVGFDFMARSLSLGVVKLKSVSLEERLLQYRQTPGYGYNLDDIYSGLDSLHRIGRLSSQDFEVRLFALLKEPRLSLRTKILIDDRLYQLSNRLSN